MMKTSLKAIVSTSYLFDFIKNVYLFKTPLFYRFVCICLRTYYCPGIEEKIAVL